MRFVSASLVLHIKWMRLRSCRQESARLSRWSFSSVAVGLYCVYYIRLMSRPSSVRAKRHDDDIVIGLNFLFDLLPSCIGLNTEAVLLLMWLTTLTSYGALGHVTPRLCIDSSSDVETKSYFDDDDDNSHEARFCVQDWPRIQAAGS